MSIRCLLATSLVLSCLSATSMKAAEPAASAVSSHRATTYNTVAVKGLNIFYREAGPRNAPAILLLHGFPSSSRMFETLMPLLADRYHLIAPDYPGFGNSEAPSPENFPIRSMRSPTSLTTSRRRFISTVMRSICRTTADRSVTGSPSRIPSG